MQTKTNKNKSKISTIPINKTKILSTTPYLFAVITMECQKMKNKTVPMPNNCIQQYQLCFGKESKPQKQNKTSKKLKTLRP